MTTHIKCALKPENEIHRFSVEEGCTQPELFDRIAKSFNIQSFSVKYLDDENDLINITTTEELQEAIRITKLFLKTPVLHLVVEKTTPTLSVMTEDTSETIVLSIDLPVVNDEEHEYPDLDPSQWDAPKKESLPKQKVMVSIPVNIPSSQTSIPISITTQNLASRTAKKVLKASDKTRAAFEVNSKTDNVELCSQLRATILSECEKVANETARLCADLSSSTSNETAALCARIASPEFSYSPVMQYCNEASDEILAKILAL
eukprot:CAMPEP_0174256970 /NCGR_PEP_ID=MMETSP0439-20130205/6160_1 /TAXON_ID=0 /ORGANISM="Stereomyxa ramosa, Strain Chinc5" /LENGTH=260 /DNA_ID=CAMNT_0015339841 /DNA_START=26 /DNA_END=808 /DNA_ORIENTATION=-